MEHQHTNRLTVHPEAVALSSDSSRLLFFFPNDSFRNIIHSSFTYTYFTFTPYVLSFAYIQTHILLLSHVDDSEIDRFEKKTLHQYTLISCCFLSRPSPFSSLYIHDKEPHSFAIKENFVHRVCTDIESLEL